MASPIRVRPAPGTNDPIPAMTAPQQTPLASFREGYEDFGTQAVSSALLGYDAEVAGLLGPRPYEEGKAAQEARVAAANERSPMGTALGDLAGNVISPVGAVAGKALGIVAKGVRKVTPVVRKVAPKVAPVEAKAASLAGTMPTGGGRIGGKARVIGGKDVGSDNADLARAMMEDAKAGDRARKGLEKNIFPPTTAERSAAALPRTPDGFVPGHYLPAEKNLGQVMNRGAVQPQAIHPSLPDLNTEEVMRWGEMRRQAQIAESAARLAQGRPAGQLDDLIESLQRYKAEGAAEVASRAVRRPGTVNIKGPR